MSLQDYQILLRDQIPKCSTSPMGAIMALQVWCLYPKSTPALVVISLHLYLPPLIIRVFDYGLI